MLINVEFTTDPEPDTLRRIFAHITYQICGGVESGPINNETGKRIGNWSAR